MNLRNLPLGVLTTLSFAAAGCGGSDAPTIDAAAAKLAVERAASLSLTATPVDAEVKEQGLEAAFSNQATSRKDRQIVFVFDLKDADTVDSLSSQLKASVGSTKVKLYTNENLVVLYGATGDDNAAKVKAAVEAL